MTGDCELAACCRDKGHEGCEGCSHKVGCGLYIDRRSMASKRIARRKEEAEEKEWLLEKKEHLVKRFNVLSISVIPIVIVAVLELVLQALSVECTVFSFSLSILLDGLFAFILFNMVEYDEQEHIRKAVMLYVSSVIIRAVALVIYLLAGSENFWMIACALALEVVSIFTMYHECNGYADIIEDLSKYYAQKWRDLWKTYMIAQIVYYAGTLLSAFLLFRIAVLGAALVLVGIAIARMVYLVQTTKELKNYAEK